MNRPPWSWRSCASRRQSAPVPLRHPALADVLPRSERGERDPAQLQRAVRSAQPFLTPADVCQAEMMAPVVTFERGGSPRRRDQRARVPSLMADESEAHASPDEGSSRHASRHGIAVTSADRSGRSARVLSNLQRKRVCEAEMCRA